MVRQWLKDSRNDRNLTQKEVAELVGIAQPSYHLIESGENTPSVKTAKKIAQVLGFDWTLMYQDD